MQNNKWTLDEEKQLVLKLRGGGQMKNIAEESGRSYGSIKERLKKIIYENIKNVDNQQEVQKIGGYLNLDTELIKKYYHTYKDRFEQQNKKVNGEINNQNPKEQKIEQKIEQNGGANMTIKKQNEVFEEIIKNYELKKKVGKLIKTKQLDKDSKEVLKKLLLNIH